jgi:hypothetical protein
MGLAGMLGVIFTQARGARVLRAEEATMSATEKANIFNDVVRKMFGGEKVSREEFGEFVKAQNDGATSGLNVGAKIPDFSLPDQSGNHRSFRDLAGPDGLLLVFSRSADW